MHPFASMRMYLIWAPNHKKDDETVVVGGFVVYETIKKKSYFIAIVLVVWKRSFVLIYVQAQRR